MMKNKDYINGTSTEQVSTNWISANYICPYCRSTNTVFDSSMILTSNPPQNRCKCKDCGKQFFSSQCTSDWSNNDALNDFWKQDQSILNIPKIGDPTPGELPYWIPFTPDPFHLNPPYKQNNYGWICPKCGRVLAPHLDSCKFCGSGTITTPVTTTNPNTFNVNDYLSKSINDSNSVTAIPNPNNKLTNDSDLMNYITTTQQTESINTISSNIGDKINSNIGMNKVDTEEMKQKFLNESESVFEAVDKYKEWKQNKEIK